MRSLVIGLGIGNLYRTVLQQMGADILTVDTDPAKHAEYSSLDSALQGRKFDTVHICTPNFTHLAIAKQVAPHAGIVFVEKPGVETAEQWQTLIDTHPGTRFMMVKNNMWRSDIARLSDMARRSCRVEINWIRKDCVPYPGSWFTTRAKSFGGVSRDLVPHLLSLYIALNPDWGEFPDSMKIGQEWKLDDITHTDYGVIDHNGVYDVDDFCELEFGEKWKISANWRSMDNESSAIICHLDNGATYVHNLGWCPEDAYYAMLTAAVSNRDNDLFWQEQQKQDIWIHNIIGTQGAV